MNFMLRFSLISFALFALTSCVTTSNKTEFEINSIVKSTNWHDRVFILVEKKVWERRWQAATNRWDWVEHGALNETISLRGLDDLSLGPLLCSAEETVCRLFVRIESPRTSQGRKFTEWAKYTFNPDDTDYSDFATFDTDPYPAYTTSEVDCTSNFSFDALWHLYCILDDAEQKLSMKVYDVDLTELRTTGRQSRDTSKTTITGIEFQPCVMSRHDVFYVNAFDLWHVDSQMRFAKHSPFLGKNIRDVSDGFHEQCFLMENDGRLFARRYSTSKGWVWDNHGRPMANRHLDKYGFGSLRQLTQDKLVYLFKPTWGNMRLYERWRDSSDNWHWSDHGHIGTEHLSEVGWANGGTIFLRTQSGSLVQRAWRGDLGAWIWQDHGTP